jgi:hypothetical protein
MTDHTPQPSPAAPRPTEAKDPLGFDRTDRWGLGILLAVVVAVTVFLEVVAPVVRWLAGEAHPLEVVTKVSAPGIPLPLADDGAGLVEVLVPDPPAFLRLLDLVPGLLVSAMLLTGCWLLLRLMRTIAAGDPFHPANVRRLRLVAGFLVLGMPVVYVVDMAASGALLGRADAGGAWTDVTAAWLDVPWAAAVSGMVVALLAEAFKAGSRLRDDVEGLV